MTRDSLGNILRVSYGLSVRQFSALLHFSQIGCSSTRLYSNNYIYCIHFIYLFFVHRFFLTSVKHINQPSFKCSEMVVYGHDNFIIISFVAAAAAAAAAAFFSP